uniref:Uncharacterized protein n=1 Tax=Lepisosteus oculatus TaxID=7918 RepID=W5M0M6_LEPOC
MKSELDSGWILVLLLCVLQVSVLRSGILFLFPEMFQVLGPAGPVVATVGEHTVLPCYLSPSISVLHLEIRWFRGDFSKPLFLYLNQRPRLQNQNPFYKGRTDLFPEEFPRGNASLFLKGVRGTDDGQYTCMVKSTNWYEEAVIDVAVRGVGTQPSVSLHSNEGGQTQLVCRSEGWFRKPAVNWTDKDGQDVTSLSSTTAERDRQGLLSVSSYIPVKQESNIFSCLVRSTVPQLDLGSELHIPRDFSPGPSGWMVALILTLFLSAGAAALLIINWRKLHVQLFLLYLQLSLTVQLADSSYLVPDQQYNVDSRFRFHSLCYPYRMLTEGKKFRGGHGLFLLFFPKEDLTLNPDTAQRELLLSEDGKRVRRGNSRDVSDSPERFDCWSAVLSQEGFTKGRHYWEVEVNKLWTIGVARESVKRKGAFIILPQEGYWTLFREAARLSALTEPLTSLSPSLLPRTLGVFLDIEERQVSFYKVESREHIYTFRDMAFNEGEKLFLFFRTIDEE